MLCFRGLLLPTKPAQERAPLPGTMVEGVVRKVVRPAHFFVGPGKHLEVEFRAEDTIPWEVFRGRLLDPAHTTERRTFATWNVYLHPDGGRAEEPFLSIKLDGPAHR